ncbi:GNAT family N-acetyltransferase [Streptomyces lavendulocolor]|uniref:GNAT family N-acetyltransferase n=1 Tax=Streptomyces lavendulocolor TaxID=67316 RepID=UPI003406C617
MTFEDIPFVVAEHLRYFPDGFFARLGTAFLSAYCETYVTSPDARGYIAQVGHQPAGFLVGVIDPAGHRGHVLQAHRRRLAMRALTALAVRPRVAAHFLRTRLGRYARKLLPSRTKEQTLSPTPPGVTAVLAHVAVVGHARSRGIGAALVTGFVAEAADAGCARVSLVTLADDSGAGPYYERHGWVPRGETRTPEGRRLATYDFPLPGAGEVH